VPTPPNSNSGPTRNTPGKNAAQPRGWGFLIGIAVLLLINLASATLLLPAAGPQRVDIPYTLFKQQVEAANVAEIASRGDTIQGTFRQPVTVAPSTPGAPARSATDFATVTPAFADPGLETLLEQQGAVINARSLDQPANPLLSLLLGFGPTVLLIGAFLWLSGRLSNAAGSGGGMFSFGRSRAKRYDQAAAGVARITFADVAGIDEARAELIEVVDFLKAPNKYSRLGGAVPRGVLLVGPPGTGKHCWHAPLPARPTCHSSAWAPASSSR
jgi:cell division protease FtsH